MIRGWNARGTTTVRDKIDHNGIEVLFRNLRIGDRHSANGLKFACGEIFMAYR
jgi:hypothetical protein